MPYTGPMPVYRMVGWQDGQPAHARVQAATRSRAIKLAETNGLQVVDACRERLDGTAPGFDDLWQAIQENHESRLAWQRQKAALSQQEEARRTQKVDDAIRFGFALLILPFMPIVLIVHWLTRLWVRFAGASIARHYRQASWPVRVGWLMVPVGLVVMGWGLLYILSKS